MNLLIFMAVTLSKTVETSPVFLSCSFDARGVKTETRLTIDENKQSMTVDIPATGYAARVPEVFTTSDVRFSTGMVSFDLSRLNLELGRRFVIGAEQAPRQTTVCVKMAVPKRAF